MASLAIQESIPVAEPNPSVAWAVQISDSSLEFGVNQTAGNQGLYALYKWIVDLAIWSPVDVSAFVTVNQSTAYLTWPVLETAYYTIVQIAGNGVATGYIRGLVGADTPSDFGTFTLIAGSNLAALQPVCVDNTGVAQPLDGAEITVSAMVGLTKFAALTGASARIYLPSRIVPGFTGLTPQHEYRAYQLALVGNFSAIPANAWSRSVGIAISTTQLFFQLGEPESIRE